MNQPLKYFLGISVCLLLAGCDEPRLDTAYAAVQRPSVNGIGVFVDLLRATGRRVDVLPAISPRLERYSTVIVFHETFESVPQETQKFLEELPRDEQGNAATVILALRDCDWAIDYWDQVALQLEKSEPKDAVAARQARDMARVELLDSTRKSTSGANNAFYTLDASTRTGIERAQKVACLPWTHDSEERTAVELDVDFPLRRKLKTSVNQVEQYTNNVQEYTYWKVGDEPLLLSYQHAGGPTIGGLYYVSVTLDGLLAGK